MKPCHAITLAAAALLLGGCSTAAYRSNATTAYRYGTDAPVVDRLEGGARLSLTDIAELGRRGVPDTVILDHLQRRSDTYRLATADVTRLQEAGVSERVINYLLASRDRTVRVRRPNFGPYGYGRLYRGFGHGGGHSGGRHR